MNGMSLFQKLKLLVVLVPAVTVTGALAMTGLYVVWAHFFGRLS